MDWYTLRVDVDDGAIPVGLRSMVARLEYQQEQFVGAHFKIGGLDKAVRLDTRELAEQYAEACKTVFAKRYSTNAIDLTIQSVEGGNGMRSEKSDRKRVEEDSRMVRARLEQQVYVPNKRPEL
ncbi:MAG: hypothetical protein P8015_00050 [Acidihalobacter sp.]|jgi:hypothetical protein